MGAGESMQTIYLRHQLDPTYAPAVAAATHVPGANREERLGSIARQASPARSSRASEGGGRASSAGSPVRSSGGIHVVEILDSKRERDAETALKWLDSLGLGPLVTRRRHFLTGATEMGGGTISELADGVLLCRLVQRLDRLPGAELPGFVAQPRSPAQCLQNIRRACEALGRSRFGRKIPLR